MSSATRPRVFLDIETAGKPIGRLVIELFTDKTPKTCENFRQLCTGEHEGLSYQGSPFHRVINEFMIQGGDIANGDGTGIASIYGGQFDDENLDWRALDATNLVCSANRGKDTNGSQFFITLAPSPHLNGRHTIFGRVATGEDILQHVAQVKVDDGDKPLESVTISRCGELERRKTTQSAKPSGVLDASVRGRSGHESDKLKLVSPAITPKKRRPSDNVRDEGLRGRPRKRSKTRADSTAIDEDSVSEASDSPVKIHKRRRSPSPGPAISSDEHDRSYERRRRRSLPNQYTDKQRYVSVDERRSRQHNSRSDFSRQYSSKDSQNRQFGSRGEPKNAHYDQRRQHDRNTRQNYDDVSHGRDPGSYKHAGADDGLSEEGVKFKGRGTMKYREPGRL